MRRRICIIIIMVAAIISAGCNKGGRDAHRVQWVELYEIPYTTVPGETSSEKCMTIIRWMDNSGEIRIVEFADEYRARAVIVYEYLVANSSLVLK